RDNQKPRSEGVGSLRSKEEREQITSFSAFPEARCFNFFWGRFLCRLNRNLDFSNKHELYFVKRLFVMWWSLWTIDFVMAMDWIL
ncbi:hypothetical protein, partial [Leptospira weilii]|uniref:hypothetical protein n=1 Tax=Leptospira weilii TaxID=28184 RepID=UPI001F3362A1